MEISRDGAWEIANKLTYLEDNEFAREIKNRDEIIEELAKIITNPGFIVKYAFKMIRLSEKGSVADKISYLQNK